MNEDDKLFAQNTKNGKAILEALKNDSQAYKDVIADVLAKIAAKHAAETNIANKSAAFETSFEQQERLDTLKIDGEIKKLLALK